MNDAMPANPFPGLRPFDDADAHVFFGREDEVDAMVDTLAATRFLVVVGPSGCGKSSLVRCGLRPALQLGRLAAAGSTWRMLQFRPGGQPIQALAQALAWAGLSNSRTDGNGDDGGDLARSPAPAEVLEATLRRSRRGLVEIAKQASQMQRTSLLLVVDQFEELFRIPAAHPAPSDGPPPGEDAAAFVALLLEAAQQPHLPVYVVLTMRADFVGDCTRFTGLVAALNAGMHLLPRLSRDECREIIVGPVAVAQAAVAPRLVLRLVNDAVEAQDELALLQHALTRTWEHWAAMGDAQSAIDLQDYEAIGGVTAALNHHADQIFAELASDQQLLAERMFKALTDKVSDARGIRKPTSLERLSEITGASSVQVAALVDMFRMPGRGFLMPPASVPLEPLVVVDLVHESLMRRWWRLDAWASEEAESVRLLEKLATEARDHAAGRSTLLQGAQLQQAQAWQAQFQPSAAWAAQYSGDFEMVLNFLAASEMQRRQGALRAARLRAMRWLGLVTLVAAVATSALVALWFRH